MYRISTRLKFVNGNEIVARRNQFNEGYTNIICKWFDDAKLICDKITKLYKETIMKNIDKEYQGYFCPVVLKMIEKSETGLSFQLVYWSGKYD